MTETEITISIRMDHGEGSRILEVDGHSGSRVSMTPVLVLATSSSTVVDLIMNLEYRGLPHESSSKRHMPEALRK